MISAIVITLYTILLLGASYFYLRHRYQSSKKKTLGSLLRKYWKYLALTVVLFAAAAAMEIPYALTRDIYVLPVLIKWSTLLWGTYLLAKVDYHEKKIPNEIIGAMLLLRLGVLGYEIISNLAYWQNVLMYPLLGAAIGGIIMAAAMLISRKGVGMGDVKMFLVIGAFVGSTEILTTMFYTFVFSAFGGIILLVTRKATLKDSVPMAPFAFAGVLLEYFLLMAGG